MVEEGVFSALAVVVPVVEVFVPILAVEVDETVFFGLVIVVAVKDVSPPFLVEVVIALPLAVVVVVVRQAQASYIWMFVKPRMPVGSYVLFQRSDYHVQAVKQEVSTHAFDPLPQKAQNLAGCFTDKARLLASALLQVNLIPAGALIELVVVEAAFLVIHSQAWVKAAEVKAVVGEPLRFSLSNQEQKLVVFEYCWLRILISVDIQVGVKLLALLCLEAPY